LAGCSTLCGCLLMASSNAHTCWQCLIFIIWQQRQPLAVCALCVTSHCRRKAGPTCSCMSHNWTQ
jgi:hypothetical protein